MRFQPLTFLLTFAVGVVIPDVVRADAPPAGGWLHDGLVISGTWGAGQMDQNGKGIAGTGVAQMTVVSVDGAKVILVSQAFNDLRAMGMADPVPTSTQTCFVATVEQCGDFWMSPAKLAAIPNDPEHGSTVGHVAWKIPTGDVDCVQWVEQTPGSYANHVFDAKTGLCYHFATRGVQGNSANGDFLAMRDLKVPWGHEAPPDWVKTAKALHYRGNTVMEGAMVNIPISVMAGLTVTDRGENWLLFNSDSSVKIGSAQPLPNHTQMACGRGQFGGIWAGPAALATLKQGQVLDEDPVTQIKTIVTSVTGDLVIITRSNNSGQSEFDYDKQTGLLKGSSFVNAQLKQKTTLQLQSRE